MCPFSVFLRQVAGAKDRHRLRLFHVNFAVCGTLCPT